MKNKMRKVIASEMVTLDGGGIVKVPLFVVTHESSKPEKETENEHNESYEFRNVVSSVPEKETENEHNQEPLYEMSYIISTKGDGE